MAPGVGLGVLPHPTDEAVLQGFGMANDMIDVQATVGGEAPPAARPARRPQRPLVRTADGAILGGVCNGVARRLGVSVKPIRVLAVLSLIPAAIGLLAYMAIWALIPREGESHSVAARVISDRRQLQIVLAVGTVALAVLVTLEAVGLRGPDTLAWPVLLSTVGALCVWRGASPDEREHLQERLNAAPLVSAATSTSWKTIVLRSGLGGALVLIGVSLLSSLGTLRGPAVQALVGTVAVCIGFLVVFAPWWLRTVHNLTAERRARLRAQERADVAAHLHDSVLQTLSLIQKAATQPSEVSGSHGTRSESCVGGCSTRSHSAAAWATRRSRRWPRGSSATSRRTTASASNWSSSATARSTTPWPRSSPRDARRPSTPRSGRGRPASPSTPRWSRAPPRSSSATSGRGSTPRRCRRIARGSRARSSSGWVGTAAARRSGARSAPAPRSSSSMPLDTGGRVP